MKTYKIKYGLIDNNGNRIKSGKIIIKNSESEFIAKCRLEDYMKRKHPNMKRMEIYNCVEHTWVTSVFDRFSR